MARVAQQAVVPVELLHPNPWNTNVVSPENEARIEASLKRFAEFGGFFKPITVRTLPDGTLQILGGEHRWEAAKRLKIKEVPIYNVGQITEQQAREIGLVDNSRYGEDDTLLLSKMLKDLGSAADLASFLPHTSVEFENIFAAGSIDLDALGLDGEPGASAPLPPKPPATHQVMRFKIPVEKIAVVTERIERIMREFNYTAEDSLSNAGAALVHVFEKG